MKNSLEKARKPENLPDETSLKNLRAFSEREIQSILADYSVKKYAYLRNLVVARVTLYNARRGEEGTRILRKEWMDGMKGVWLPKDQVKKIDDPAEQYLIGKYKLIYTKGKGQNYVSVLIPLDLIDAIYLLDRERKAFGIKQHNIFLFAAKSGKSHCSGWHAVSEVCKRSKINIAVNATRMRHWLSTIYASLEMKPSDREIFLQHMGHGKDINKENYQCPPGIRTVCIMGKMLGSIDEGKSDLH